MKTAYLFPGQGSQFVGMGRDLCREFPESGEVFDEASRILGFDLGRLCFEGPEEKLRETRNTQPALFTQSVAVWRALGWDVEASGTMLAGHSLGEYTAYVVAGALDFADGLRLVRRRGELMSEAGLERPGTMAAVLGLAIEAVEEVLGGVGGCVVAANLNSPGQVVISGEIAAVENAMAALKEAGARRVVALEVSGAFHSPLMEGAARGLGEMLCTVSFRAARCPVLANATATVVTEPEEIRRSLSRQLLSPVRWDATVRAMLDWGAEVFYEVGPGKVLSGLVRAVSRDAVVHPLGTVDQVRECRSTTGSRR